MMVNVSNNTPAPSSDKTVTNEPVKASRIERAIIGGGFSYVVTKIFIDRETTYHPHFLASFAGEGIVVGLESIYQFVLYLLGDRSNYETMSPVQLKDKLRSHAWKVVTKAEGIAHRIDCAASRVFKMRTQRKILQDKISDLQLNKFEILRKTILVQIPESFKSVTARWGSCRITVLALGYTLPVASILVSLAIAEFFAGWLTKANAIIKLQEEAEAKAAVQSGLAPAQEPQADNVFARFYFWIKNRHQAPATA